MENTLFSYNGAYIPDSIMIAGEGYWLRFENSGTSAITGIPINELTLNLNEGWNLISGLTEEISIYSATDSDSIIIPGTLYGFDGSYFSTEMMIPGAGFWLRTYQDGEITLSGRTLGKKRPRDFNLKDKANTLNINGSELHFGLEFSEKERMSYSLPPKPPTGVFDVRFKDGWKLVKDFGEIEVTNPGDILTISYNIQIEANENMNWVLTSESGKQYILKNAGEITVPTEETFILEKITAIPISFAMHQNYPNPFNPVTTLKYDLPEQAFVSLSIYDMLGREIIQLINANQNAGFKSIRWDATDSFGKPVSAGVYLYQIKAGDLSPNSGQDFVQTRKMVLMK
jgi:hypothetical protein